MIDGKLNEMFTKNTNNDNAIGGLAASSNSNSNIASVPTQTLPLNNVDLKNAMPSISLSDHRPIAMKRPSGQFFEETNILKPNNHNSAFMYDPINGNSKHSTEFILDENMDDILNATDINDDDIDDDDDDGPSSVPSTSSKRSGRRKIRIEYIEEKSRRHITFSKRKAGIMKKAYELSTLTGTQVLLLVASETGHVYTFATPKLQPLITKAEGKNLIQACLNAPDNAINEYPQSIRQNSSQSINNEYSHANHQHQHQHQQSSHIGVENNATYDDVMNGALSDADQQLTQKLQLAAHYSSNQYIPGRLNHLPNYSYNTGGHQNISNDFIDTQYNSATASSYWPNPANGNQRSIYHQNLLQSSQNVLDSDNKSSKIHPSTTNSYERPSTSNNQADIN